MYVVGQQPQLVQGQTLFGGNLTVVNLSQRIRSPARSPSAMAQPGATSRMIEADDNTLWIAMTGAPTARATRPMLPAAMAA